MKRILLLLLITFSVAVAADDDNFGPWHLPCHLTSAEAVERSCRVLISDGWQIILAEPSLGVLSARKRIESEVDRTIQVGKVGDSLVVIAFDTQRYSGGADRTSRVFRDFVANLLDALSRMESTPIEATPRR